MVSLLPGRRISPVRTRSLGKFMVRVTQSGCLRQQNIEFAGLLSAKVRQIVTLEKNIN